MKWNCLIMTWNYVIERQRKTFRNVLNKYNFPIFWGYKEQIVIKSYKEYRWEGFSLILLFFVIIQMSLPMCPASIWIEHRKGQLVVILFHILKLIDLQGDEERSRMCPLGRWQPPSLSCDAGKLSEVVGLEGQLMEPGVWDWKCCRGERGAVGSVGTLSGHSKGQRRKSQEPSLWQFGLPDKKTAHLDR